MAKTIMKLKNLQSHLEGVETFDNPKILLEQYPTTPHIAAIMLHKIQTDYGEIDGSSVLDLGCGCGILSIGAIMMGAAYVLGVEIDEEALEVCQRNLDDYDIQNVDLLLQDVVLLEPDLTKIASTKQLSSSSSEESIANLSRKFDIVIMNPPFGTKKNVGIDMKFLETGLAFSRTVYSLHKTSTRQHLEKRAKDWNVTVDILGQFRFNLSQTFKCHKDKSVDIEVDFVRFEHKKK